MRAIEKVHQDDRSVCAVAAFIVTHHSDLTHRRVRALRRIEQSSLDAAPAVPRHQVGFVEDWDACAELHAVDFGDPWGVVLAEPGEIEDWPRR